MAFLDDDENVDQHDPWEIITTYFNEKGLVRQQMDSYNDFLNVQTQKMFDHYKDKMVAYGNTHTCSIQFGQVNATEPVVVEGDTVTPLYPNTARLRKLTYGVDLVVDVTKVLTEKTDASSEAKTPSTLQSEQVVIGTIPVMVRSDACRLSKLSKNQNYEFGECPFDQGGYFIVRGVERVLIAQERRATNTVCVFAKKQPAVWSLFAEITSLVEKKTSRTLKVALRSGPPTEQTLCCILPYVLREIPIFVLFRALGLTSEQEILQHMCFDLEDTDMLMQCRASLLESKTILNQQDALHFIGLRMQQGETVTAEKRMQHAKDLLIREFLPHINMQETGLLRKAMFLGYIVHRILSVHLGRRPADDRDHFANKRLDIAGALMGSLFALRLQAMVKDMLKRVQDHMNRGRDICLSTIVDPKIISSGLQYSLSTGNWGSGKSAAPGMAARTGVSQVLNRMTYSATLSHLRRSNAPLDPSGKMAQPRQLHNTHWGLVCPAETPEGHQVGLVKNLALMAHISVGSCVFPLMHVLDECDMIRLDHSLDINMFDSRIHKTWTKVLVNGDWIGLTNQVDLLVHQTRRLRQHHSGMHEMGIYHDTRDNELRFLTDTGRCMRPLFSASHFFKQNVPVDEPHHHIAKRSRQSSASDEIISDEIISDEIISDEIISDECSNKCLDKRSKKCKEGANDKPWESYLQSGLVEYVDTEEEETSLIALFPQDVLNNPFRKYTHIEMHPSMILGVCASIIPFSDHNQSPRNTYQSAMGKQAMGLYATNFGVRFDTLAHVLFYPQKPLVTTRAMDFVHFNQLPSGQNACVAIAPFGGYNQEDSLILNKSSVDRGFGRSMFYRMYFAEDQADATSTELVQHPTFAGMKAPPGSTYELLDDDGLPHIGMKLTGSTTERQVVIGKVLKLNAKQDKHRDASVYARKLETGVVDAVMKTTDPTRRVEHGERDGSMVLTKIRTRCMRVPQIGDKFSSRHGQKGICGMMFSQEDMPFTRQGMVPDIVMNPHAIPSRMTIGQLIECLCGKMAAVTGNIADATPFQNMSVETVADALHQRGYQRQGSEVMYNGQTGKRMLVPIFFGPTYYQRLKHMVEDKIHWRCNGRRQHLVRQPTEGRGRDGGLRFGDMERDCMISHGAATFLKERLFRMSDDYSIPVCNTCGMFATTNKSSTPWCLKCKASDNIAVIEIPYAAKLMFQELFSMAITPKLFTA